MRYDYGHFPPAVPLATTTHWGRDETALLIVSSSNILGPAVTYWVQCNELETNFDGIVCARQMQRAETPASQNQSQTKQCPVYPLLLTTDTNHQLSLSDKKTRSIASSLIMKPIHQHSISPPLSENITDYFAHLRIGDGCDGRPVDYGEEQSGQLHPRPLHHQLGAVRQAARQLE